MRTPKVIALLTGVAMLPLIFNQCGRAEFQQQTSSASEKSESSLDGGTGNNPGSNQPSIPVDPEVIAKACGEGSPKSQTFDISFEENKTIPCDWDNTPEKERHFGAMRSVKKAFALPVGSTLCGLAIESTDQEFQYDDYFVFALDKYVIAASQGVPINLAPGDQRNPMVFDWMKLKDKPFNPLDPNGTGSNRETYDGTVWCARGMTGNSVRCEFPKSDTSGRVRLELPDRVFQGIVAMNPKRVSHDLEMILIGDNDPGSRTRPTDCTNKKIDLKLRATFVQTP